MSYRVAITSSNGECIDQHFGSTKGFYILQIEETGEWEIIELRKIEENKIETMALEQGKTGACSGHNVVFIDYVGNLLSDCTYILTNKIGMKPYKALLENNINALEAPQNLSVAIEKVNRYYLKK